MQDNVTDSIFHLLFRASKMYAFAALLIAIYAQDLRTCHALECYSCQKVDDVSKCNTTVQCSPGESCALDSSIQSGGIQQIHMGCLQNQNCGSSGLSGVPVGKRQTSACHECCSTDLCNSRLCLHQKPSDCVDDESEDCARLHSLFIICSNKQHAKLICPKFCGLCNIVDGNWAQWSVWATCDVTCGNGTQLRTRTCTNPAPAHGGNDCVGSNSDRKQCLKDLCPVHGSWSDWSPWGTCSSSCDIGMQRRDRSCSNPYPSRFGQHCYGDSTDDRICIQAPCANGGWSAWTNWSTCSVTCGTGLKKRNRKCDNPERSLMGKECQGSPEDIDTCFKQACHDGGWANWGSWSTCSLTCGGGVQSRSRTCSNPKPSILGQNCIGEGQQTHTCNSKRCPPVVSAFSVDYPYNYSSFHGTNKLTFSKTIYQHGGNFDPSSGTFTCTIPGTYHFSVTLVKKRANTRVDMVYCYLYKSGSAIIRIRVDPTDDDTDKGNAAVSQSVVIHLNRGDTVYLSDCSTPPSTYMEYWSSFTGFLLYPDN